jgi:hypothetical protein
MSVRGGSIDKKGSSRFYAYSFKAEIRASGIKRERSIGLGAATVI